MKTISATEFKTRCVAVVTEVHSTREPVLITKHGKPVARLMPAGKPAKFIGRLKGIIEIVGDIESPIVPPEDWTSDLDNLDGSVRPRAPQS
jgi:prevent-host-death family protein